VNPRAIILLSAALALVIPAQLGSAAGRENAADSIAPSRATGATVAKVVVNTVALAEPGAGKIKWRVTTETQWGHGPQQLLVLDQAVDQLGRQ